MITSKQLLTIMLKVNMIIEGTTKFAINKNKDGILKLDKAREDLINYLQDEIGIEDYEEIKI